MKKNIISICELYVTMATRVPIQLAKKKPYAAFPPDWWCFTWNLIKIYQLTLEIYNFKSVDEWCWQTPPDHCLTSTSLQPSAFDSGALKKRCHGWVGPPLTKLSGSVLGNLEMIKQCTFVHSLSAFVLCHVMSNIVESYPKKETWIYLL